MVKGGAEPLGDTDVLFVQCDMLGETDSFILTFLASGSGREPKGTLASQYLTRKKPSRFHVDATADHSCQV